MKKNLITISLLLLLFVCCSDDSNNFRISKIIYKDSGDEYIYYYGNDGSLARIDKKYYYSTSTQTQSFFHTESSSISSSINYLNYYEFDSRNLTMCAIKLVFNNSNLLDTISFEYEGLNDLSKINHNDISYSVEVDERGNILEIKGGDKIYRFTYDKKPNPFQSIPNNSMIEILEEDIKVLMAWNIAQYFSNNNILTFSGWNGPDNKIVVEYVYGINGYPRKVLHKNGFGDHDIYYDLY